MTTLILMRHGETESSGYADDDFRRLTEKGKLTQKIMAERLKKMHCIPDKIYSSDLIRAIESAEVVGEVLGKEAEQIAALGLSFDKEALFDLIDAHVGKTLLFIGHMPTLPSFVNELVGKEVLRGMKQSSFVKVDIQFPLKDRHSVLIEYITPDF